MPRSRKRGEQAHTHPRRGQEKLVALYCIACCQRTAITDQVQLFTKTHSSSLIESNIKQLHRSPSYKPLTISAHHVICASSFTSFLIFTFLPLSLALVSRLFLLLHFSRSVISFLTGQLAHQRGHVYPLHSIGHFAAKDAYEIHGSIHTQIKGQKVENFALTQDTKSRFQ